MKKSISITPSEVMEYLYCPRFIYFMLVLQIPQKEEQRYKVQRGRKAHDRKTKINKKYFLFLIDWQCFLPPTFLITDIQTP